MIIKSFEKFFIEIAIKFWLWNEIFKKNDLSDFLGIKSEMSQSVVICRDLVWSGVIQDIPMTPILVNHPSIQFSLGGFTRDQELVITTVVLTCYSAVYFYVWVESIPWDKRLLKYSQGFHLQSYEGTTWPTNFHADRRFKPIDVIT